MGEPISSANPLTATVAILQEPATAKGLLDPKNETLRAQIQEKVNGLDSNNRFKLAVSILGRLGQDIDDPEDQNIRDGLVETLGLLQFNDILHYAREKLLYSYAERVSALSVDADPLGSVSSMLNAGRILTAKLNHEFRSSSEMLPCHSRESGPFDYTQDRTEQYRMCRNLYK